MLDQSEKRYWALLPPDELIPELTKRRHGFLDLLETTGLFDRVLRTLSLYHGVSTDTPHSLEDGIQLANEDGSLLNVNFNALRASLALLKTYITAVKVEWDCIAHRASARTLLAAKQGNLLLDEIISDSTSGLEASLSQAVEDALVLTTGYNWVFWDDIAGSQVRADPSTGIIYYSGALRFLNPCFTDVVYDPFVRDFKESRWVLARRQENRWDLAASYPKHKRAILDTSPDEANYARYSFDLDLDERRDRDFIWRYYFFLRPSPAAPTGRFMTYVGNTWLEDNSALPYGHVPIHRIVPAQFLLTPFGFTPAFSAEAPQQLLDSTISTIATNQNALGTNKVWKKPGEPIARAQLEPGVTIIECETEPKNIQLLNTPPELFKSVEVYLSFLERMIGVNAAAHGQVGERASGSALAFTAQRTQQAASDLVAAYDIFLSDVATSILKILRAQAQRDPAATQSALDEIDRVSVVRGNPLLRNLEGRVRVGEVLMQAGAATPDEFLTLTQTGNLEKLTEAKDRQLELLHEENDAILRGEPTHKALNTDNQIEHIKGHANLLTVPSVRDDPEKLQMALAAVLEHKQLLVDPETQLFQTLLYGLPSLGAGPPPGGPTPGGSPPAPKGTPSPPAPSGSLELSQGPAGQPQLRQG